MIDSGVGGGRAWEVSHALTPPSFVEDPAISLASPTLNFKAQCQAGCLAMPGLCSTECNLAACCTKLGAKNGSVESSSRT